MKTHKSFKPRTNIMWFGTIGTKYDKRQSLWFASVTSGDYIPDHVGVGVTEKEAIGDMMLKIGVTK